MELYAAAGAELVRELTGGGRRVFLDMKFYRQAVPVSRVSRSGDSRLRSLSPN
jgi:hypothetical protein